MYSTRQKKEIRKLYTKCQKSCALNDLLFVFTNSGQNGLGIFEKNNGSNGKSIVLNRVNESSKSNSLNLSSTLKIVSFKECMPILCKDLGDERISNFDLWILEKLVLSSKTIEEVKRFDDCFNVIDLLNEIKDDLIKSVKSDFDYYCEVVYHQDSQNIKD